MSDESLVDLLRRFRSPGPDPCDEFCDRGGGQLGDLGGMLDIGRVSKSSSSCLDIHYEADLGQILLQPDLLCQPSDRLGLPIFRPRPRR